MNGFLDKLDQVARVGGVTLFWVVTPTVIALNIALIIACWPK